MDFVFRPFVLPYIIGAVISLVVALLVLQRQNAKGSLALAVLMFDFALWAGADAVRWSLADPGAQPFWIGLSHAVFVPAPLTFLIFVAQLTELDRWMTPRNLLLLAVEPVATILVIATNSLHHLFYGSFQLGSPAGFPEMLWTRGPWFWLNTAFSYGFILAAALTLVRGILRAGPFLRVQLVTVLVGCLIPWGVNAYMLLSEAANSQLELTPLAAAVSGVIFAYALFRQRLLDIVPVARSLLFEQLGDGVLVLDTGGRLLDANRAARRVLHIPRGIYGKHIWDLLPQWRDLGDRVRAQGSDPQFEVQGRIDPSRFYEVSVIRLTDNRTRPSGYLVSLRDITERKRTENELHRMNVRLQRQVRKISSLHDELQEQAIRDPLTGLYNRRYLDETLEREFSRARRADYPISVILIDVDEFKRVNDTYSHKAGDRVLRSLGEMIQHHVRAADIPCRYGGEEFVIILPETPIEVGVQRAEQLRAQFEAARFFKGQEPLVPTLSIGVASYPSDGRSAAKVLHAADLAMYASKSLGGNKAIRYIPHSKSPAPSSSKDVPRS